MRRLASLLLFGSLAGFAQKPAPPDPAPLEDALKRFVEVYARIEAEAADPFSPDQAIFQGAIPSMLRRLDPHSAFLDAGQFEQLKEMERSVRKGFGSIVSVLPGRVIVLQTLPGTPTARSGISAGDEILAINGIALGRLDMDQLVQVLGESRQQQARLEVRKPGNARIFSYVLIPEDVESSSVDRAFLLRPDVGYVRVTSFENETGAQLQKAIEGLGGAKLKGLVLDLRNNPGGVLPAALEVSALFFAPGTKILGIRGRSVEAQEVKVADNAKPYEFKLAVLMNGKSASASEIVAGAVQDLDRGAVIGEPSFGKGLVQSVFQLDSGTGMALTTAYYYTPSGRNIQRPLRFGQLEGSPEPPGEYKTAKGRTVKGGGGILPDEEVYPEKPTAFRAVMEASASFPNFATEFVQKNKDKIKYGFDVSGALLDDFRVYLSERKIQPGIAEWSRESEWIRFRLKQEIYNQALGVDKGDEVEMQRDPVVRGALRSLGVE
jgi:carboxyl-terminal processing protease